MADDAVRAGPAIKRLRKRENLTQAAMAARLSISPSYLNLIERNQRPVSARVVMAGRGGCRSVSGGAGRPPHPIM